MLLIASVYSLTVNHVIIFSSSLYSSYSPIYREEDIQKAYKHTTPYPHVFVTAAVAFAQCKSNLKNQAVLISGESGAGKTETTKRVLSFLSSVGAAKTNPSSTSAAAEVPIEVKILQSNPLLEALGNAKTLRNNNSSRFGKWMKVEFDRGKIYV